MKMFLLVTAASLALSASAQAESHVAAGGTMESEAETSAGVDATVAPGPDATLPTDESATELVETPDAGMEGAADTVVVTGMDGPVPVDVLIGAEVYSVEGDDVGEISDIVFASADEDVRFLVDVGGFLGFGEHTVALSGNDVTVTMQDQNTARVDVTLTREALEDMPEYEPVQ
ncbi:PRC-barrel domain-containing protein [Oceanibium sediminis]|uniref:PRC-barrel domain-containing protein n=1 Tax=Oceanibium sediminis TaxID=2026339 RepID=UPI000DD499B9|nr:PRC-barrel domain-containing protein [Oceanibium sediminis]